MVGIGAIMGGLGRPASAGPVGPPPAGSIVEDNTDQPVGAALGVAYAVTLKSDTNEALDVPDSLSVTFPGSLRQVVGGQSGQILSAGYNFLNQQLAGEATIYEIPTTMDPNVPPVCSDDVRLWRDQNGHEAITFASDTQEDPPQSCALAPPPTPTPEPSTLSLLGIGTFGLLGYAWRRRQAA
jgi:hypothetical protein